MKKFESALNTDLGHTTADVFAPQIRGSGFGVSELCVAVPLILARLI
jgi:hypothetical protein